MGPLDLIVEELCILKVASLLNMTGIIPIIDTVSTESLGLFLWAGGWGWGVPSKTYYARCLSLS